MLEGGAKVHLPGVQHRRAAAVEPDAQPAVLVDAVGGSAPAVPRDDPAGESVAGAPGVEEPLGRLREAALQRGEDDGEHGGDVLRGAAQRAGPVSELPREVAGAQRPVDPDPEDGPAPPRPRPGEDPPDPAPPGPDGVGAFDRRPRPPRGGPPPAP